MTWKLRLPGSEFTKSKDFLPHPQWEKLPMGPSAASVEPPPFKWIADPPIHMIQLEIAILYVIPPAGQW